MNKRVSSVSRLAAQPKRSLTQKPDTGNSEHIISENIVD